MNDSSPPGSSYQMRQLAEELPVPESGKQSIILSEDAQSKVMLFAFAAGHGLPEHQAPLPATIQLIKGEAILTVGEDSVGARAGTWVQMATGTPHSIKAETPVVMLLTLFK